jgi:molybdate transport system substrate-binding protein
VAVLAALAVAGCGGDDERPVVAAASSLRVALAEVGDARIAFGGSDELTAQIRTGARIDVFVAAGTELPAALRADGLAEEPVPVATNELVVAVPAEGGRVRGLGDLSSPGVRIALGAKGVPVGDLAHEVIGRLGGRAAAAGIARNVVSKEPDVAGVVAKVAQGAVDAGFVYATDVRATPDTRALTLPAATKPRLAYAAVVVGAGRHADAGRAYVRSLLRGDGARALRAAGFGPPP